ncbi:hypothetical protein TNIN_290221 [Trichonephila inaurata madagascariensis]|uniref:Uncharacterized protein n=1 Tax=Trichonephila inaurata madagascariensis TaxID=2747483 RepID=A0A8X6XE66_9ARAC|nr:hypothetical protein TNIN_290221 [Trichonephila inaurata madagascariensis]
MHLVYGVTSKSGRRTRQVYEERYPGIKCSHVCIAICANVVHCATTYTIGRKGQTWAVNVKENVLQYIEDNPNTSPRAQKFGICQTAMWWILHEQGVYPYHLKRMQLLPPYIAVIQHL